jgi:hypothetical protein
MVNAPGRSRETRHVSPRLQAILDSDHNDRGRAWQIYAGYRIMKYFAVEGRYTDFGEYRVDLSGQLLGAPISGESKASYVALSGHALGLFPFGGSGVDIYGQLGLGMVAYSNKLRTNIARIELDDSSYLWSAGAGVRYTPTGFQYLTVLLGYDWYGFEVGTTPFGDDQDQSIGMGKLGIQYNF